MRSLLLFIFIGLFLHLFGQTDTIYWQKKSPCPCVGREDFGRFLIDSDFYIMGGFDSVFNECRDVWKYNIPTDHWQQMNNLPEPTTVAASFELNAKGYMLTARDSINGGQCDSAFFEYDPTSDTWTRRANLSDSRRQAAIGFSYNGKGYIGFGEGCGPGYRDLWQYDTASNQWAQMNALPAAIPQASGMAVAIPPLGGMAYLMDGGWSLAGYPYRDMWSYDISADHWDSLNIMPGPGRNGPALWGFDSVLLGGGGEIVDTTGNVYCSNDYYKYNITHNIWTTVQFMNFIDSTGGGAAFIIGHRGYFWGGAKTVVPSMSYYNDMWSFDATPILPYDSTTVGIRNAGNDGYNFKLYPNPVDAEQSFQIATSAAGQISFYNSLGQVLFSSNLNVGMNKFKVALLNDAADVVFYKAMMKNGSVENGRMVVIR